MIKQVSITSIPVIDQEKALDFYVNKLGFQVKTDAPYGEGSRWLELIPTSDAQTSVALHKPGPDQPNHVGEFTGIGFITDDIDATYKELSARGVKFTQQPSEQPWGKMALFADQDNNIFVLSEEK